MVMHHLLLVYYLLAMLDIIVSVRIRDAPFLEVRRS